MLKVKSNIHTAILDNGDVCCDKRLFKTVFNLRPLLYPDLSDSGKSLSFDLKGWIKHCETFLQEAFSQGCIGLKCAEAYERSLRFDKCDFQSAGREYAAYVNAYTRGVELSGDMIRCF